MEEEMNTHHTHTLPLSKRQRCSPIRATWRALWPLMLTCACTRDAPFDCLLCFVEMWKCKSHSGANVDNMCYLKSLFNRSQMSGRALGPAARSQHVPTPTAPFSPPHQQILISPFFFPCFPSPTVPPSECRDVACLHAVAPASSSQ